MTDFWKSDTHLIVKAMKATGNQPGVVAAWKASAEEWAKQAAGPDAEAVRAWLPLWHVRPVYTAAELAPMWPMLSIALGFAHRPPPIKSANRLANELKFAGLPVLQNSNGTMVFQNPLTNIVAEYFIVERLHYWRVTEMSQREFAENIYAQHG